MATTHTHNLGFVTLTLKHQNGYISLVQKPTKEAKRLGVRGGGGGFRLSPSDARKLAESLQEWADAAEDVTSPGNWQVCENFTHDEYPLLVHVPTGRGILLLPEDLQRMIDDNNDQPLVEAANQLGCAKPTLTDWADLQKQLESFQRNSSGAYVWAHGTD